MITLQKDNGGIVMVNFYPCYITDCSSETATVETVAGKIGECSCYTLICDTKLYMQNYSKLMNIFDI